MTKDEALELIDNHKNRLFNPKDMLPWTYLRVILAQIPEEDWDNYLEKAYTILTR